MARIILIETSTSLCSTALAEDGKILCSREDPGREHASLTAQFISETLKQQGLTVRDCDAVCVSSGPGSYTGLRVGVSTAKGLCFGGGLKLLSLPSPDVVCEGAIARGLLPEGCTAIVPMIDARRMEVYTAVYSPEGRRLGPIEAKIVEEGSFADLLGRGPVLFAGDGALKCREVLSSPNAFFAGFCPCAADMARAAERAWDEKRFEDVAYFEPFYLKEFQATVPRRKLF